LGSNYSKIPIIDHMSTILGLLDINASGITPAYVLEQTDIPRATVYRLLRSMVVNRFLSFDPKTKKYYIGPKFLGFYSTIMEKHTALKRKTYPCLEELAHRLQETVKLSTLCGLQSYTLARVEGTRSMRISINDGAFFPLHAGATGKILMSFLQDFEIEQYFETPRKKYTPLTRNTLEAITEDIEFARANNYVIDRGEYISEIRAVAVPIQWDFPVALSVTYPSENQKYFQIEKLVEIMTNTAKSIESSLLLENEPENARLTQSQLN